MIARRRKVEEDIFKLAAYANKQEAERRKKFEEE